MKNCVSFPYRENDLHIKCGLHLVPLFVCVLHCMCAVGTVLFPIRCVHFSFAIIPGGGGGEDRAVYFAFVDILNVMSLLSFLISVPWVCLWCTIVAIPSHTCTHLQCAAKFNIYILTSRKKRLI